MEYMVTCGVCGEQVEIEDSWVEAAVSVTGLESRIRLCRPCWENPPPNEFTEEPPGVGLA